MKKGRTILIFLVLAAAMLLSACTGTGASSSWPGITVDGQRLYVASGPYVYAINADNGSQIWKYPEKANAKIAYYAAPALTTDGQLIVGDYHNGVTSLNPETGAKLWSFVGQNRFVAPAAVTADLILAPSSDNFLYALDHSGQKVWSFKTGTTIWTKPIVAGDTVYLAGMDHYVYALRLKDGSKIWSTDVGAAVIGSAGLDDQGVLYVGTLGKVVLALDTKSGNILWRYQSADSIWSGIVVKDKVAYFGDLSGQFTALSTETQKPVWQYKAGGAIVSEPLVEDTRIAFTTENGSLVSLDPTGKLLETKQVAKNLYGSPVKAGDLTLIPSTLDNIILYAYDASGAQRWTFAPAK